MFHKLYFDLPVLFCSFREYEEDGEMKKETRYTYSKLSSVEVRLLGLSLVVTVCIQLTVRTVEIQKGQFSFSVTGNCNLPRHVAVKGTVPLAGRRQPFYLTSLEMKILWEHICALCLDSAHSSNQNRG